MSEYSAKIVELWGKENLTPKERIQLADMVDVEAIDAVLAENPEGIQIDVDFFYVVDVHNDSPKVENSDYTKYVIVAKDGKKYATGSENFFRQFERYYQELKEYDLLNEFTVRLFRTPSPTYRDKYFITCSLV